MSKECTQGRGRGVCDQAENSCVADGTRGFREVLGLSNAQTKKEAGEQGLEPGHVTDGAVLATLWSPQPALCQDMGGRAAVNLHRRLRL